MDEQSKTSQGSTTHSQEDLLNPDTPIGVINLTAHTLITELINVGWPVNVALEFGADIAAKSAQITATLRQRIKESTTVH